LAQVFDLKTVTKIADKRVRVSGTKRWQHKLFLLKKVVYSWSEANTLLPNEPLKKQVCKTCFSGE